MFFPLVIRQAKRHGLRDYGRKMHKAIYLTKLKQANKARKTEREEGREEGEGRRFIHHFQSTKH